MDERYPYRAPDAAATQSPRPAGLGGARIAVAAILAVSAPTCALNLDVAPVAGDRPAAAYPSYLRAQLVFDALPLALALAALAPCFRRSPRCARRFAAWAAVATLAEAVRPLPTASTDEIAMIQALAIPLGLALSWYGPWSLSVLGSPRSRNTFRAMR